MHLTPPQGAAPVESAGYNGRLPKAITTFLCSVDGNRIKTCQAVEFGVGHRTKWEVFIWVCEPAKGVVCWLLALVMIGSQESRNSILSWMDITLKASVSVCQASKDDDDLNHDSFSVILFFYFTSVVYFKKRFIQPRFSWSMRNHHRSDTDLLWYETVISSCDSHNLIL